MKWPSVIRRVLGWRYRAEPSPTSDREHVRESHAREQQAELAERLRAVSDRLQAQYDVFRRDPNVPRPSH